MGQITNGIDKIEITEVGQSNWRILGYTNIDTASITEEEGTTTDFNVEELDTPIFSRFTPGKTSIAYDIADPVLQTFVEVFGGAVTGVGQNAKWEAPTAFTQKEFAVRVTPKVGYIMQFNRMVFKPLKNFSLGKNNITAIRINADMLQPAGGIAPFSIGGLVDGNGGTSAQLAQTITFASQTPLAVGATRTLPEFSSVGLTVTYQATDPTKVGVNGNVITGLVTGTTQIIATQLGNSTYLPANPVVQSITIN